MDKKKKSVVEEVQETMTCSAFAEAGEPCPLHEGETGGAGMTVQETMACTAFAEAGEPCPIDKAKEAIAE